MNTGVGALSTCPVVKKSASNARLQTRQVSKLQVKSGDHAVERRTVNRGDGGSIPPASVSKLRQFHSPHIACVFRKRHYKPVVPSIRGSKRSHTGGKCVTCSGLTNSRERQL